MVQEEIINNRSVLFQNCSVLNHNCSVLNHNCSKISKTFLWWQNKCLKPLKLSLLPYNK